MVSDFPQNVVVTGAADGIGFAIAKKFMAAGFSVHICDNRATTLETALAEYPSMKGTLADISDPAGVRKLFEDAHWMGPLGVLVNNVGIGGPVAAIEDISADEWRLSFEVNALGTLRCMQTAIPGMKQRRMGAIINISTASTKTRLPMRTAYVASKYAVEGLTLNAARELGPWNIRCNAILPGLMNNARMDQIIANRAQKEGRPEREIDEEFLRFVSMRQRTEPDDVAEMACFLASSGGARVTGELISVSGNLEWES